MSVGIWIPQFVHSPRTIRAGASIPAPILTSVVPVQTLASLPGAWWPASVTSEPSGLLQRSTKHIGTSFDPRSNLLWLPFG